MNAALTVTLAERVVHCSVGDRAISIPVGPITLARSIGGDPPAPADLTNAIGLVIDHLEDVERELPEARLVDTVHITGHGVSVLADVELGATAELPRELTRTDLEDLFRTLAVETTAERRLNPELPDEWVHDLLGTCCALVGLYRHLDLAAAVLVG